MEALLPFLADPLEGVGVGDLVRLLGVGRSLGHHHQGAALIGARHGGDVEAFLPLLHDPLLGQEVLTELIHLPQSHN